MIQSFTVLAKDGHVVRGSMSQVDGAKGAALLVHGITSDRHEWGFFDALSAELNSRNITSIAIDYRGHGESTMPIAKLSLSGVFLDIEAGWKHLQEVAGARRDYRKAIIGNSFGGGLAFLLGAINPEINVTIATCPVMSYIADLGRVNSAWRGEAASGFIRYASKGLPAAIIVEMWAYDSLIELAPTPHKCAIFHGTSDSDVPYSESEKFAKGRTTVVLKGLHGMDHSFSAPEGVLNRDEQSKIFRAEAGRIIAEYVSGVL
jgi:pimeloyl-ACP methyl ester carboxylesterase